MWRTAPRLHVDFQPMSRGFGASDAVREIGFGPRIGAEDSVPNHQHRAHVAIGVPRGGAVVYAMVRWCVEPRIEAAKRPDRLGVQPRLVVEARELESDDKEWRQSEQD